MVELLSPDAKCLIDGAWVGGDTLRDVTNPANGQIVGRIPQLDEQGAEQAIKAAHRAMPEWSALTAGARGIILRRFYDLIVAREQDLAKILTAEQGKPLAEALGEIRYAASFINWFAEEGKRAYGDVIPTHDAQKRLMVLKQPVGVVAAITPWNFPAAMVTRKVGPALAAGCTVVLKPAEQTPFTALALGALALEAGVPAGVFNIITGDSRAIGKVLTESPVVRKITFTGSTEVGSILYRQSAATIKKLSLELGGNAPFIVFEDADLDRAVEGAMASKFRNAGQTCVCANRFYVHEAVYDQFVAVFSAAAARLKVAPGDEAGAEIGPLIDQAAFAKVNALVNDAVEKGATVVTGGPDAAAGDLFYRPAILANVSATATMLGEEIFGPVAPIVRFRDEEEVLALANGSPFGLSAYFYSRDVSRVWRVAEALEVGMVGINTGLISTEVAPFGGVKLSGLGREGSRYGIEDYLVTKFLCLGL